jgi:small subunit ribosomal protein S1
MTFDFEAEMASEFESDLPAAPEDQGGNPGDDQDDDEPKRSDEFAKLFEASLKSGGSRRLKVGDRIKAEVLMVGKEEIFVSTGTMHDGTVHRRDLIDEAGEMPYQAGDKLDLYVTLVKGSEIRLSPKPTSKNLAEDLMDAYDKMLPVEGRVVELCKGGVRVQLQGKMAFCPISQLDVNRVETGEEFIGKKLAFRITQLSEGGRNIVVSRRRLLDEERELVAGTFLSEHKAGDVVKGKVTRLEKFGAFVELAPGIDGLCHISELSWNRVADPSEVVTTGQEVTCKILKIENMGRKVQIGLSIKQVDKAPPGAEQGTRAGAHLEALQEKFAPGMILEGTVDKREAFGIFIKLGGGASGLLPKSKAADHPEFPYEKLKKDDKVQIKILETRPDERRPGALKITLCPPQMDGADDWRQFTGAANASAMSAGFGTLADKLKGLNLKTAPAKKKG